MVLPNKYARGSVLFYDEPDRDRLRTLHNGVPALGIR